MDSIPQVPLGWQNSSLCPVRKKEGKLCRQESTNRKRAYKQNVADAAIIAQKKFPPQISNYEASLKAFLVGEQEYQAYLDTLPKNLRYQREKDAAGSYTVAEWQLLCAKYQYRCICCEQPSVLTVDHIVPLVRGGSHNIENLQPLCRSCNSRKGTRTIDYRR